MDEQLYRLQFERADLLKRIDEDQDDLNDLMQKHKDLIAQVVALGKRLGGLGCMGVPPLEVRPSSVAPDPAESRGAPSLEGKL